jgi:hypothetical protein
METLMGTKIPGKGVEKRTVWKLFMNMSKEYWKGYPVLHKILYVEEKAASTKSGKKNKETTSVMKTVGEISHAGGSQQWSVRSLFYQISLCPKPLNYEWLYASRRYFRINCIEIYKYDNNSSIKIN